MPATKTRTRKTGKPADKSTHKSSHKAANKVAAKPEPPRCPWPGDDPLYQRYHDTEWGVPVRSDKKLFEFLLLEGVQAGLSWITVLRKRENYRKAFDGFDWDKIARYDANKIAALLQDPGIVRNRLKINAAVTNARAFIKVREEFGTFSKYIWSFTGGKQIHNSFESMTQIPPVTPLAETISKDLKKRGFTFVGPTIIYAHMQATGMVNDHLTCCFRHQELS
ncbi:MAG TPA: DNA-3-methyladenine glycosylase I [Candidatus Acidoferrum sp.]|nr:DNA-3-methyladenine glycosylase I [Candidatus Acidoferrum sp.]